MLYQERPTTTQKTTRLSRISPEILVSQGSIVRLLLPSFGQKVIWPIRYLSFEFWQFMLFMTYSLHFSDMKFIDSFVVFFITVFSKYHGYRQSSIFCHARLKSILVRNDSCEIDRVGVKWKSVGYILWCGVIHVWTFPIGSFHIYLDISFLSPFGIIPYVIHTQGWASQAFSRVESSPSHFKMGPSRVESSYFNHLFLFS